MTTINKLDNKINEIPNIFGRTEIIDDVSVQIAVCPYCDHEHKIDPELASSLIECSKCGLRYNIEGFDR